MNWKMTILIVLGLLAVVALVIAGALSTPVGREAPLAGPDFGEDFWKHWGDGKAELAGYELVYPRYGEPRRGTAVTIFVTETFSRELQVKRERPGDDDPDRLPVMKLNLIQDFRTGIYDYNLMTSAFVALETLNGRPAGSPSKIAFSSQEWCGQVYSQLRFDDTAVRLQSHSYFDGEADLEQRLHYPPRGVSEDALLLWARGLAAPRLGPGESLDVRLIRSLEGSRLGHLPLDWMDARLSRGETTTRVEVPAGAFEVEILKVEIAGSESRRTYPPSRPVTLVGDLTWTFFVETAAPHRLIRWTRSDGFAASLLDSKRLSYWKMNSNRFEEALSELGLQGNLLLSP